MIVTQVVNKKLLKAIEELSAKNLKVGWGENQKYPNGVQVAYIASIQEFGNPNMRIPPRPFMRPSIAQYGEKWAKSFTYSAKKIFNNKLNVKQAYTLMGDVVAGDIRHTISNVSTPPLSNTTVALRRARQSGEKISVGEAYKAGQSASFVRGSGPDTKPLIDTGLMMNSLTSEIGED